MKITKYFSLMIIAGMAAMITSCLEDGEDTFALQKGDFENLIHGAWKVESCRLYNPETGKYESDFVNATQLGYVYTLGDASDSNVTDKSGHSNTLVWNADEEDHSLTLGSSRYTIESLGHELMVLSVRGSVNGADYLVKYYLHNIGSANDGNIDAGEDATFVVSTDESGTFCRNGYTFTIPMGAVPKGDNGNDGSVAFSVENVPVSGLPGSAPSGVDFVDGTGIFASPSNFVFSSPIVIDVPLNGIDSGRACLYHWNPITGIWEVVPFSSINSDGTASVSVLELGYFVVGVRPAQSQMGGIMVKKAQIPDGYYYYLTIVPSNGAGSSSVSFTSGGKDLYMANVPMGSYRVQITRERRTSLDTYASAIESATVTLPLEVRTALQTSGSGYSSYRGWTVLNLPDVNWNNGRPSYWGEETVTYGTGVFQATLNWVNNVGSTTDYDLHLTTPNGSEVYFSNKKADGFELDRDVISNIGNCTENIYSISETLPAGTYKVRVHHFGGATGRSYNCRVIINGRVVRSYTGVTDSGYQDISSFTLQ